MLIFSLFCVALAAIFMILAVFALLNAYVLQDLLSDAFARERHLEHLAGGVEVDGECAQCCVVCVA